MKDLKNEAATPRADMESEPRYKGVSDALLLRRIDSDPQAIWILWRKNEHYLVRVIRSHFALPPADVEDVRSTTMMRFHAQLPRHAPRIRNLRAWTLALARNVAVDYVQEKQRFRARHSSLDECEGREGLAASEPLAQGGRATELRELSTVIHQTLDSLSDTLRNTAVAYFVEQKSYPEIADSQRVDQATIRKRIQTARGHLKPILSTYLKGQPIDLARGALALRDCEPSATALQPFEIRADVAASKVLPTPGQASRGSFQHVFLSHHLSRENQRLASLKAYVGRHPLGGRKRLGLAELYFSAGRWDEALACYEGCRRRNPNELTPFMRAAEIYFRLGRSSRAVQMCQEALGTERTEATQLHILGLVAQAEGRIDAAQMAWTQAISLEPANPAHYMAQAAALREMGRDQDSKRALERVLRLDSKHLQAQNLLLDQLEANGEHELLRGHAESLYSRGDTNAVLVKHYVDRRLRICAGNSKQHDHLRRLVVSTLERTPGFPGLLDIKAALYAAQGQWRRLHRHLDEIISTYPHSAGAWKVRAVWLSRRAFGNEALRAIREALRLGPTDPKILETAAYLTVRHLARDNLREILEHLVDVGASRPRLLLAAAVASATVLHKLDRALELSRSAVQNAPDDSVIAFGHARLLTHSARIREAAGTLRDTWDMISKKHRHALASPTALELAMCMRELGKPLELTAWCDQARERARDYHDLDPTAGRHWKQRADVIQTKGGTGRYRYIRPWDPLQQPDSFELAPKNTPLPELRRARLHPTVTR